MQPRVGRRGRLEAKDTEAMNNKAMGLNGVITKSVDGV